MGNKTNGMVPQQMFNYKLMHEDTRKWCKTHQSDLQTLSQEIFFRTGSYLSNGLSKGALPLNVLMKLSDVIGQDMKRYEITPKPAPKPEPEPELPVVDQVAPNAAALTGQGWETAVMVNEEFGTVAMKIMHDGEVVAIGRSYLYGKDLAGVVQSISYASHMCYKLVQQRKIADRGYQQAAEDADMEAEMEQVDQEDTEPTVEEMASRRMPFKDWVKRYQDANSAYGKCARYINSHYPHFPSTSEKKMRYYLRLNGGETHIQTFDVLFAMYRNQDRQQYAENSKLT